MKAHVRLTIQDLEAERDKLDEMISLLEQLGEADSDDTPAEPVKRKQRRRAVAVPVAPKVVAGQPPPVSSASADDNSNVTPLSDRGIAIGKTLTEPFTPTDLNARLDGDTGRAYTWIAAWKRKTWIETVGFGQYKRAQNYGVS